MRIGVLGGTFNPIHNAHLQMAVCARDVLLLDRVLLTVAADPPHKQVAGAVPGAHRLEMARLAVQPLARIEADGRELLRPGKSYTVDTLCALAAEEPGAELFLIVGSDMLTDFVSWREPARITRLCTLASVPRAGRDAADGAAAERLRIEMGARIVRLPSVPDPVSSTLVRARAGAGLPCEGLVPDAVEQYFTEQGLYMPQRERAWLVTLRAALSPKRYAHTCAVAVQAARLAQLWGADPIEVRAAALLHDCAKCLPIEEQRTLAGGDMHSVEQVVHAKAGAALAQSKYGVTDPAVLSAIARHCTGEAGMTLTDMVVYLADASEALRTFPGVDELRARLADGPDAAMRFALARSLSHIRKNGWQVDPATERTLAYFEKRQGG